MKLNAFHGQCLVTNSHDLSVGTPRRDLKVGRERIFFNNQTVITREAGRAGHAPEYALAINRNRLDFSVNDVLGPDDVSAERVPDGLMSQTHTQNRYFAGEGTDQIDHAPRFLGPPWSWTQNNGLGIQHPH